MAEESKGDVTFKATAMCVAPAKDGSFVATEKDLGAPGEYDLIVKVISCGSCHTDHFCLGRPGAVPGHETVGRVVATGSSVTGFTVGQRVGMGWQLSSCHSCEACNKGVEQCCPKMRNFMHTVGGYSTHIKWDSRFVFPIPDGISSRDASPLLCAGATMYSALVNNGVKPGQRVGIIGIGGLGHIGLQFANAWGCHVSALSRSADKEEAAKAFGAHEFINTKTGGLEAAEPFDFLLSTVSASLDWTGLLDKLKPCGKLCIVGVPTSNISFPARPLLMKQLVVCGSLIGSPASITDMLKFAQLHNIKPKTESVPLTPEGAATAIKKVAENTARYRMVLEAEDEDATATK